MSAAIALSLVIFVTYSYFNTYKLMDKMDVIETRVETVNFFIKDVEKDIKKGVFITSFRTLLSFSQFIATNGSYLDSVNLRFKESFLNGTVYQQVLSLMQDSTFTDWANKIAVQADKIGISFNFTIRDVRLSQTDPWYVDVGLNITLEIRDKRNTSYWVQDKYLTTKISILEFEDPLYTINSKGRVPNTIIKSNITDFVVGGDVTKLMVHTNNSYYIAHNDSPSFLMRFEGNISNSTYGIESLVNLDKFQQQGLLLKDRSIVDSVYFSTQFTSNYRINATPDWFKIDQSHLLTYQVNNLTV